MIGTTQNQKWSKHARKKKQLNFRECSKKDKTE
jgi:hypothetical protein